MVGPFGVTVVPAVPDRSEFLRDAEAALRVGNPRAARTFLLRLSRRRAWAELYEEFQGRAITRADVDARHQDRTRELYRICEHLGFLQTQVTHIALRQKKSSIGV